jgi:3-oxoacyl-(acyl-carrier-protein) synthase
MEPMGERVVITGGGAISPFGAGLGPLVAGVAGGRRLLARAEGACVARVPAGAAAAGPFSPNAWRRLDLGSRMAVAAAWQALQAAGYPGPAGRPAEDAGIATVLGTMSAGIATLRGFLETLFREGPGSVSPMLFPFTVPNAPASQCSILLGLTGPNLTLCEMEASGLAAIATAADLIRSGVVEGAVAGAVDEWSGAYGRAWGRLRLTHRGEPGEFPGPCAQNRRGFTPGEGAYLVMLESLDRARRRGAVPWAEVKGETIAHARGPAHAWPRDAEDVAEAIRDALTQAGLGPDEIGYVAASANGTRALDAVEARALRLALGGGLRRVPVTSVKGAVGESAAASACSALVGALSIRDGFIPPVAGLVDPAADLGLDLIMGEARRERVPSVLVHALGTGGSACCLVLVRPEA